MFYIIIIATFFTLAHLLMGILSSFQASKFEKAYSKTIDKMRRKS